MTKLKRVDQTICSHRIANTEAEVIRLNLGYYNLVQAPPDEPIHFWQRRVHPDDFEAVYATLKNCLKERSSIEFRFRKGPLDAPGEPEWVWVEGTGNPKFNVKGELTLVVGFTQDITTRIKAEQHERQRAEDALAMKKQHEQFIDTVSAISASSTGPTVELITHLAMCPIDFSRGESRCKPQSRAQAPTDSC